VKNIFLNSNNLTIGYGNEIVIKNLSLSLSNEKNYEIIGKNGSGKTTLSNFISYNFEGNLFDSVITRDKLDISEISPKPTLLENLTLDENIAYFTHYLSLDEETINSKLEKFKLTDYRKDSIKNFSSGMIKRSELAICDIKNPDVLCIDEPLNYLDKEGIEILEDLLNIRSSEKKCSILSSQESLNILTNIETINLNEV